MRNPERQYTRREVIGAFSATALIYGESAFLGRDLAHKIADRSPRFGPNFPDVTGKTFPTEGNFVTDQAVEGRDRIFCASTIKLVHQEKGMSPSYGHGSIVNLDGKYQIYTIEHVAKTISNKSSFMLIPGVGAACIQPERIVKTKKAKGDTEQAAYYILGPNLQRLVEKAVEEERLMPLRQYYGLPKDHEEVIIPSEDKGEYQRYRFVDFSTRQNLMFFESFNAESGENCQGDSGSPILRLEKDAEGNEFLTGEMYGVLQGSSKLYPVSDRKYCATYFSARPNN